MPADIFIMIPTKESWAAKIKKLGVAKPGDSEKAIEKIIISAQAINEKKDKNDKALAQIAPIVEKLITELEAYKKKDKNTGNQLDQMISEVKDFLGNYDNIVNEAANLPPAIKTMWNELASLVKHFQTPDKDDAKKTSARRKAFKDSFEVVQGKLRAVRLLEPKGGQLSSAEARFSKVMELALGEANTVDIINKHRPLIAESLDLVEKSLKDAGSKLPPKR